MTIPLKAPAASLATGDTASPDAIVTVRGLTKRYGKHVAVDGISFDIRRGEIFGMLGPNGAGKTTTLEILEGIRMPDAGEVRVVGLDVRRSRREVQRRVGVQLQATSLFPELTARETLALFGSFYPRALSPDALLREVALEEKAKSYPQNLSGGQRQRLALALALVNDPDLLFLDEPTTGLDLVSRNSLWALIRELVATGTTVVLTTQYLEEADRLADRIAVIDRGRLIANDTPAALKARLGATVLELAMPSETLAARAAEVLAQITGARIDQRSRKVTIVASDGSRLLIDAVHLLDRASLIPRTLQVREPTLDDVFLRLTGHPTAEQSELTAAVT